MESLRRELRPSGALTGRRNGIRLASAQHGSNDPGVTRERIHPSRSFIRAWRPVFNDR